MQGKRFRWLGVTLLAGFLATSAGALGQGARLWVDPPHEARTTAPSPASPAADSTGTVPLPSPTPRQILIPPSPTPAAGTDKAAPAPEPEEATLSVPPDGQTAPDETGPIREPK